MSYSTEDRTKYWDDGSGICYVNNKTQDEASPKLENCFFTTEHACCNYIEDQIIGDQFESLIPTPCLESHPELILFMCIGCSFQSFDSKHFIKAEPTVNYIRSITKMMEVQNSRLGILRNLTEDVEAKKGREGYVKVCASWAVRMWGYQPGHTTDVLRNPTEAFDDCGVYINGNAIPKPSRDKNWKTALDFMEFYGVPLMSGFGIIFVDDSEDAKDLYQDVIDSGYDLECFKSAVYLHGLRVLGLATILVTTLVM